MADLYDDDGEWWTEYDDDLYADEYEAHEQDDSEWDEDEEEPLHFVKERIALTCNGLYVVRMYLRMYPNDTYESVFSRYPLFYGCNPKGVDDIPF